MGNTENDLAQTLTALISRAVQDGNDQGFYREPLVGFSAVDDPLYREIKTRIGSWHKYPSELLPEARTVITFFIPFSRVVVEANRRHSPGPSREWVLSYHDCNSLLCSVAKQVAGFLQDRGYPSLELSSSDGYDPVRLVAGWSHRSGAVASGIGTVGLNRLLITYKGCAGRLGTVLTAAELPPTPRLDKERCLYYANGSCRYCVDHCPRQALSTDRTQDMRRRECLDQCDLPTPYRKEGSGAECCGKCAIGPCAYYD